MFIKPSFKILDRGLRVIVGPFPGEAFTEEDVIFFRDSFGLSFHSEIISPTGRYGNLKKTLPDCKHFHPDEWEGAFKLLGRKGVAERRSKIKEEREYEEYLASKNRK